MAREPQPSRLKFVFYQHLPRGWRFIEKGDPTPPKDMTPSFSFRKNIGEACFETKTVAAPPITTRYALYVALHECAHARLHAADCGAGWPAPEWQTEYEAEMYAIKAMRAAGIPVPRAVMLESRDYVGMLLEKHGCADAPDEVWRFAYPDGRRGG
jgi:hypothetical protein